MESEADPTTSPGGSVPRPAASGPQSILTCTSCDKKNKIRPSERGSPHCGECGDSGPNRDANPADAYLPLRGPLELSVIDVGSPPG